MAPSFQKLSSSILTTKYSQKYHKFGGDISDNEVSLELTAGEFKDVSFDRK